MEKVPRIFQGLVTCTDKAIHVGHVVRWLKDQGFDTLAGRLRQASRVRNATAHPLVDGSDLMAELMQVASDAQKDLAESASCGCVRASSSFKRSLQC